METVDVNVSKDMFSMEQTGMLKCPDYFLEYSAYMDCTVHNSWNEEHSMFDLYHSSYMEHAVHY